MAGWLTGCVGGGGGGGAVAASGRAHHNLLLLNIAFPHLTVETQYEQAPTHSQANRTA